MQNVIITGDSEDKRLTEIVIKACAGNGGALVIDGKKVYEMGNNPKFCVMTGIEKILCNGIVILGDEVKDIEFGSCDIAVIVDSENMKALELLKQQECKNVITCSMNIRASLNMSGIYPEKIASLQRGINFSGRYTEPCEFEIISDETEIYPILSAGAVMLMSGEDIRERYFI